MRILQINNYYDFGSTGKIVKDIHNYLESCGIESFVAYGRGQKQTDPKLYKFCKEIEAKVQGAYTILSGNLYGGSPLSTRRLIAHIEMLKPDAVHVHCINAFSVNIPQLLDYLATKHIKTIVTHHAEFFYTGNCSHALKCVKWQKERGCFDCERHIGRGKLGTNMLESNWKRMMTAVSKFNNGDLVSIAVSPWLKQRLILSPFWGKYPCQVVKNGINTNVFYYRKENILKELKRDNPQYDKICIHVTPRFTVSESIKGGQFIFPIAKSLPDILFIIVSVATEPCTSVPANVVLWGKARTQDELAMLYSSADVTLLTSERETYSMICAESLSCGTPVVGFKAGGPETISMREYSSFVDYGDTRSIVSEIKRFLETHLDHNLVSSNSIPEYDCETMGSEVLNIYKQILNA